MLRKLWLASFFIALTGTGFMLFQPGPSKANSTEKARVITVNETGKPPVKCKILQEWKTKEGNKAFKVESLETGDFLTVVVLSASANSKNGQAISTKIYHWGKSKTWPEGSPKPPEQQNPSKIVSLPKEMAIENKGKLPVKTAVRNSQEIPMKTAVKEGNHPAPLTFPVFNKETSSIEKKQPTEFQTVPAPGADKTVAVAKKKVEEIASSDPNKPLFPVFNSIASKMSPNGGTNKEDSNSDKIIILKEEKTLVKTTAGPEKILKEHVISVTKKEDENSKAEEKKSVIAKTTSEKAAPPPPQNLAKKVEAAPVANKKQTVPTIGIAQEKKKQVESGKAQVAKVIKPGTEDAKPQDWRKSWGQLKNEKIPEFPISKLIKEEKLPLANSTKPDPLKSVNELHPSLEEKIAKRAARQMGKNAAEKELEALLPNKDKKSTPAQMAESALPRTVVKSKPVKQPKEEIIVVREKAIPSVLTKVSKNISEEFQTGTQWVNNTFSRISGAFARNPNKETRLKGPRIGRVHESIVASGAPPIYILPTLPVDRPHGPVPTHFTTPPQAPNPFAHLQVNNPYRANRGPANGMANAFTDVYNQRPLPADMGASMPVVNAFSVPSNPEVETANQQTMMARMVPPAPIGLQKGWVLPTNSGMAMVPAPVNPTIQQFTGVLKTALYPSEREWAAEQLGSMASQGTPEITSALLQGAKEDPAPLVRTACLRALRNMKINNMEVVEAIQLLRKDVDPRVRQEADLVLIQLSGAKATNR